MEKDKIKMYYAPVLFIIGWLWYAGFSFFSIKGFTASWEWHGLQWGSAGIFILSGFLAGKFKGWNWHNFGRIIGIAVLGIPIYVFLLHALLSLR